MRHAVFLLCLAVSAAAYAADNAPANGQTDAALAGSVIQCEAPVAMNDAAAAEAITRAAADDATANAKRLAEFPAKAAETIARLAAAHSLDKTLVARAYLAALCGHLKEKGVADAELHTTLLKLAQDAGVAQEVSAGEIEASPQKGGGGGISELIAPGDARPGEAAPPAQAEERRMITATEPPRAAEMERAEPSAPAAQAMPKADLQEKAAPRSVAPAPARRMITPAEPPAEAPAEKALGGNQPPPPAPAMEEPGSQKALTRPVPAPKPVTRAKAGEAATLGDDECRALGVLEGCTDLNSVFDQLLEKPLEYNKPDKMFLGRKTEISLVLRTDWKGKDMPSEVSGELKGLPGEVQKGLSKITRVMSAELSGADFDVSPAGRQERTVILPQPVVWNWQVTPTETGNAKPLKLRLYAHLQGPGGTMPPVLIKTLDATIAVDVTAWDWVVNQAKTLEPIYAVVAGILGLLTALVTYFVTRKEEKVMAAKAEMMPVRPSGPVLGDLGQSARDSKAPAQTAPLPPAAKPEPEPEDVPWRPKKLQPPEGGGSGG